MTHMNETNLEGLSGTSSIHLGKTKGRVQRRTDWTYSIDEEEFVMGLVSIICYF